jgi:hypothetical protein
VTVTISLSSMETTRDARYRDRHLQARGRQPSSGDLAVVTGLRPVHVSMLMGAAQPPQARDDRAGADRG